MEFWKGMACVYIYRLLTKHSTVLTKGVMHFLVILSCNLSWNCESSDAVFVARSKKGRHVANLPTATFETVN